jgi:ribosomal protein L20
LSDKKGIYEKAKGEMRLSERILSALPGFRGYKEKELRRESDKLIRNHLYRRLTEARKDLKGVFQKLSDKRLHEVLTEMDRFVMRFDKVSEKINHASYGYAGFFNVLKIEEEKLDRMMEFDKELMEDVGKIVEETNAFKKEVMKKNFEKAQDHIQCLSDLVEELDETFDSREEIILGAK